MARESITSSVNTGTPERRAATHYGRRGEERQAVAEYEAQQGVNVMETPFTYDKLVDFVVGDKLYNYIPAGSQILSAKLEVTVPFLGGTSLAVGTYNVTTGAAVDAVPVVHYSQLRLLWRRHKDDTHPGAYPAKLQ